MLVKYLPNLLTVCRIGLSVSLLFCFRIPLLFLILYVIAALTDVSDGFLARRLKAETAFGAKLDSAADFVFFAAVITIAFLMMNTIHAFLIIILALISAVRLFNFIFTRVKFKRFGGLHSLANKAAGFMVLASIPVFVWLGRLFYPLLIPVIILASIAAIEETFILIIEKDYNANVKSIVDLF